MRIIITYQNANKSNNYNLTDDGITIIPNFISTDDIKNIKTMINNNEIVNVKKYIINSANSQQQIKQLIIYFKTLIQIDRLSKAMKISHGTTDSAESGAG